MKRAGDSLQHLDTTLKKIRVSDLLEKNPDRPGPEESFHFSSTLLATIPCDLFPLLYSYLRAIKATDRPIFKESYQFKAGFGGQGTFSRPSGIAVDASGSIYVVDSLNARIQVFSPAYVLQKSIGSRGIADGEFANPVAIVIDYDENLIILDNGRERVHVFNSQGQFKFTFGEDVLKSPAAIAVDPDSNIAVADFFGTRIHVFDPAGAWLRTLDRNGYFIGLTFDLQCNLVVCERPEKVAVVDPLSGRSIRLIGDYATVDDEYNSFRRPSSVVVDKNGCFAVVETSNKKLAIYSSDGQFLKHIDLICRGIVLNAPWAVAMDKHGTLFVTDVKSHEVHVYG